MIKKVEIYCLPANINDRIKAYKFVSTSPQKIKWDTNIPDDVKIFCANKINEARADRLKDWQSDILNLNLPHRQKWALLLAIGRKLKNNNRFIPEPVDLQVLNETLELQKNHNKKKKITFVDLYAHNLRKKVLGKLLQNQLQENSAKKVWIRIPSYKHDKNNFYKNIANLEILSSQNWCTKSRVDKAHDALVDGDFYVYLERDKNNLWQPLIGMTTYKGKIDQIQGVANNNIIPTSYLNEVIGFLKEKSLVCASGVFDEGPKAFQQILISRKLLQNIPEMNKNLEKAIRQNDSVSIFKAMNIPVKINENGTLEIGTYKPILNLDNKKGILIPFNMLGINEDKLLENVEKINGDMILYNTNSVYSSSLKNFPQKLKKVDGNIYCSREFFKHFHDKILEVANLPGHIQVGVQEKSSRKINPFLGESGKGRNCE